MTGWLSLARTLGSWLLKPVLEAIRKQTHIPEIDVYVKLGDKPHFDNRPDIFSVVFSLTSTSGKTKIVKGCVRFRNPNNPAEGEKQHLPKMQMLEGETKDFRLPFVPLLFYDRAMSGESTLKAECNLTLERPNGKLHQQNKQYTYDWHKKIFEEEHG